MHYSPTLAFRESLVDDDELSGWLNNAVIVWRIGQWGIVEVAELGYTLPPPSIPRWTSIGWVYYSPWTSNPADYLERLLRQLGDNRLVAIVHGFQTDLYGGFHT